MIAIKTLFFNIPKEKQLTIIEAATREFALYHYNQASLNRIIEAATISKGGLFKYIDSKADLYLFLIKHHLESVLDFQKQNLSFDSDEIIDRIRKIVLVTISFYKEKPDVYKMLINATMDQTLPINKDVMEIRGQIIKDSRIEFLEGVNWGQYNISQDDFIKVYNWFNLGLNFTIQSDTSIEQIIGDFELVLTCLKYGVMKGEK